MSTRGRGSWARVGREMRRAKRVQRRRRGGMGGSG